MGDEQMTQEQKGKTPVLDVQNLTKIYDNGGKGDGRFLALHDRCQKGDYSSDLKSALVFP